MWSKFSFGLETHHQSSCLVFLIVSSILQWRRTFRVESFCFRTWNLIENPFEIEIKYCIGRMNWKIPSDFFFFDYVHCKTQTFETSSLPLNSVVNERFNFRKNLFLASFLTHKWWKCENETSSFFKRRIFDVAYNVTSEFSQISMFLSYVNW